MIACVSGLSGFVGGLSGGLILVLVGSLVGGPCRGLSMPSSRVLCVRLARASSLRASSLRAACCAAFRVLAACCGSSLLSASTAQYRPVVPGEGCVPERCVLRGVCVPNAACRAACRRGLRLRAGAACWGACWRLWRPLRIKTSVLGLRAGFAFRTLRLRACVLGLLRSQCLAYCEASWCQAPHHGSQH